MTAPIRTPAEVRRALTFLAYASLERAPWQMPEPTQDEPDDVPPLAHPDEMQEPPDARPIA